MSVCCTAGFKSLVEDRKGWKPVIGITIAIMDSAESLMALDLSVRQRIRGLIKPFTSAYGIASLLVSNHLKVSVLDSGFSISSIVAKQLIIFSAPIACDQASTVLITSALTSDYLSEMLLSMGMKHFLVYCLIGAPIASASRPRREM